jgi:hypothetical protein
MAAFPPEEQADPKAEEQRRTRAPEKVIRAIVAGVGGLVVGVDYARGESPWDRAVDRERLREERKRLKLWRSSRRR